MPTLVSANTLPGRSSDAPVQCLSNYTWMSNGQGQNPCEAAADLIGSCGNSSYSLHPLNTGWVYTGPSSDEASVCICNPIVYNLVAACGACQDRSWVNWFLWQSSCGASLVTLDGFPANVPIDTTYPAWATQNSTGSKFNLTEAEETAGALSTGFYPAAPTPSVVLQSASDLSSAGLPTWTIVIVVVGVLAFMALLGTAIVVLFTCRRSGHKDQAPQRLRDQSEEPPAYREKDAPGYSSFAYRMALDAKDDLPGFDYA